MKRFLLTLLIPISVVTISQSQQTYYDVTAGNGYGIRFWQSDGYKIHMGNSSEYLFGPVNDYSIKTNMQGGTGGRGWTWGLLDNTPVAAINTSGNMQIAGNFQAANQVSASYTFLNNVTDSGNSWTRSNFGSNVSYDFVNKVWQVGSIGNNDFASMVHNNADGLSFITAPSIGTTARTLTHAQFMAFERMRINANGDIGIGATVPAAKLHISSADRHKALRVYMDGNTSNYLSVGQGSGGAVIDPIGTGLLYLGYDQSSNVIMGYSGGNVGIGNIGTPSAMLHINSPVERSTFRLYKNTSTTNYLSMWQGTGGGAIDPIGTGKLYLGYDQITDTYVNGKLGIGTTSPDYPLTVNGSVHAKEVRVDLTVPGPDYVFEKDYKLTSLEGIKNYIDQNKHLPEVPSAKEMEKNGVQLGEMNMILLKKIEELTLHVIEQNRKMEDQNKELQFFREELQSMKEKSKKK